jgi:hypothetical protein
MPTEFEARFLIARPMPGTPAVHEYLDSTSPDIWIDRPRYALHTHESHARRLAELRPGSFVVNREEAIAFARGH